MDAESGQGPTLAHRLGDPPRRLFLLGGGAAAVALLLDHGLRLDLPPPPPPVPTRRPAPDEDLLLAVVTALSGLVDAGTAVLEAGSRASGGRAGAAIVRRVRSVQREQRRVLIGRLTNAGVPGDLVQAALAAPRPTDSPPTRKALAERLADVPPRLWLRVAEATPGTRGLLTAAYASRLAGALRLGADVPVTQSPSAARADVLARTQPLVYAFQVVAAQSTDDVRRRAVDTLDGLTRLEVALSGVSTTAPPGWSLPRPVTSGPDAERLAREVLTTAVDATVVAAGAEPDAAAVEDVARWSARVQALAVPWGVPLAPFPGTGS